MGGGSRVVSSVEVLQVLLVDLAEIKGESLRGHGVRGGGVGMVWLALLGCVRASWWTWELSRIRLRGRGGGGGEGVLLGWCGWLCKSVCVRAGGLRRHQG